MRAVRSWLAVLLAAVLSACAVPGTRSVDVAAGSSVPPTKWVAPGPVSAAPPTTPAALTAAAAYDYDMDIFHPVVAHHGMVATENGLASQAGLEILKAGGNAVDAAVAVGFTLAVTLPNAGNLGGGGFMMVHEAKTGQDIALDFREMAPAHASRNMYLDARGNVVSGRSLFTPLAVGVPGTVAGLTHALQHWGSLPLSRVMAPAIRLADRGYPVSATLADALQKSAKTMGQWPETRAIFWRNGQPLKTGDRLVQPDLAASLRRIAHDGAAAFYQGTIARKIAAEMAQHGGLISLADLRHYKAVERKPIVGEYRGYRVVTMPPPSSGGVHLVQILNMMEGWPVHDWGAASAQTIQHMAEAMKLAYADRSKYLGDTDFVKVPVAGLVSKAYARSLAAAISATHARPSSDIQPGHPQPYESDQTTHYSVVDAAGNAVAVTYTLNTNFGSGIVAAGTGILLNNEMDDFSAKPGVANVYGLIGGDANAIQPGKRPLSSMTPTIVLKDGRPWLVTGSPGGARIITTVLETVVDAIDFGMNPAEAAATPRFHHQWWPDELRVEKGISPDTLAILRSYGQHVVVKPTMGKTQTIQIVDGMLYGASDPRNPDGATLGY
ncbi:MAG: gamma-glutamyltransferase [Castellaniella sp.]|uniref:gamma-glutamyltransferase n=1 Tax=Castellaniella sp. TaxID=1955812 RepID=UPI00122B4EB2|nr:gamma-glutamyltransferase [Castellaniella sp.]TAN28795.1 MAG: gamma-glutamyltransferase [Castellaniella sp.]